MPSPLSCFIAVAETSTQHTEAAMAQSLTAGANSCMQAPQVQYKHIIVKAYYGTCKCKEERAAHTCACIKGRSGKCDGLAEGVWVCRTAAHVKTHAAHCNAHLLCCLDRHHARSGGVSQSQPTTNKGPIVITTCFTWPYASTNLRECKMTGANGTPLQQVIHCPQQKLYIA